MDHLGVKMVARGNEYCVYCRVAQDFSIICCGNTRSKLARQRNGIGTVPSDNGLNVELIGELAKIWQMHVASKNARSQDGESNGP
jgi:hypothetical protein